MVTTTGKGAELSSDGLVKSYFVIYQPSWRGDR